MTPLHVTMLMHYHGCASPYAEHEPGHRYSTAVIQYRRDLYQWGLIKPVKHVGNTIVDDPHRDGTDVGPDHGLYLTTERGEALVEAICGLPLPEQVTEWRMPEATR